MKKKYIIIPLIILLVVSLIFISVKLIKNQRESEELEAIQIFENRAALQVFVEESNDNIDNIQKELENLEFVKNVKLVSNDDNLEEWKNKVDADFIDEISSAISQNSFIIKLDINSIDDFEKIKTLESSIASIDGINDVDASGCNEIIEVYEQTGIKGMREYNKILTIMDEQGVEGVNNYMKEHEETRKLLKDFI